MSEKKHHWFPLYHDAWIVGTRHMTYRDQGIYLNLLLLQFERGDLSMDVIKRYMPRADDWEIEIQDILEDKFTRLANGTYRNERMSQVLQEQQSKSEKRSQQTAAARASKQKKTNPVTKSVTEVPTKSVTKSVTERELELELELELEVKKEKELEVVSIANRGGSELLPSVSIAVSKWNAVAQHLAGVATVKTVTARRQKRWSRSVQVPEFLPAWNSALGKLPVPNTKSFQWQPSFDWMLSLDNVAKLLEGNYDGAAGSTSQARIKRVQGFIDE